MSISTVAYEWPLRLAIVVDPEHRDLPGLRVRQRPDQPDQGEPGYDRPQRPRPAGNPPARPAPARPFSSRPRSPAVRR